MLNGRLNDGMLQTNCMLCECKQVVQLLTSKACVTAIYLTAIVYIKSNGPPGLVRTGGWPWPVVFSCGSGPPPHCQTDLGRTGQHNSGLYRLVLKGEVKISVNCHLPVLPRSQQRKLCWITSVENCVCRQTTILFCCNTGTHFWISPFSEPIGKSLEYT